MKSNVCKIEKGTRALDEIFRESEKVAKYNDLNHKQTLQLRLLSEELANILPSVISNFCGEFWIENQGDSYELCVRVRVANMDVATRERLIKVAKDQKNSSSAGMTGKIRAVFDYMAMGRQETMISPAGRCGFSTGIDFSRIWSLRQYQAGMQQEPHEEEPAWDEFERSILVKVADDVIVGVKGESVTIMIKKNFA